MLESDRIRVVVGSGITRPGRGDIYIFYSVRSLSVVDVLGIASILNVLFIKLTLQQCNSVLVTTVRQWLISVHMA